VTRAGSDRGPTVVRHPRLRRHDQPRHRGRGGRDDRRALPLHPLKADLYGEVYAEVQDLVYGEFDKAFAHDSFRARFGAVLDATVALNQRDPSLAGFVIGVSPEVQRHLSCGQAPAHGRRVHVPPPAGRWRGRRRRAGARRRPAAIEDLLNAVLAGLARSRTSPGTPTAAQPRPRSCRLVDGTLLVGGPILMP
jgi:hypothetical protein